MKRRSVKLRLFWYYGNFNCFREELSRLFYYNRGDAL